MSAERHLPGWEAEEDGALWQQKRFEFLHQPGLVMDMLDDVLQHDEIKFTAQVLFHIHIVNIADDKSEFARFQFRAQPFPTVDDTFFHQLYPYADAAFVNKCFQHPRLSRADLQHPRALPERKMLRYKG